MANVPMLSNDLLERLKPRQRAWSVNGRDVVFTADFGTGAEVGGFVNVTTPDGRRLLVQVHDLHIATKDDVRLEVANQQLDDAATEQILGANVGVSVRYVEGSGAVIGELTGTGALGRGTAEGFAEATLGPAADAAVDALLTEGVGSSVALPVGRLARADVEARLKASGFARHTFLCGQSGSGKTYTTGVLLERLLVGTELPMVIIDPNSDYVGLGKMRSRRDINSARAAPLSRPDYGELQRRYEANDAVVASARVGDLPLSIHLSDLTLPEQALAIGLDPLRDADEFAALVATARELPQTYGVVEVEGALARRFDDASRHLARRMDNLGLRAWSVWARPDRPSLVGLAAGRRCLVLDTGSLGDARERSVVALALFGRLRARADRSPVLVVIDEAHNVCSPDARSPLERAVADHTVWIAGEGRKFGIYLVIATQRPQKVHRNVISQCDNLLLMRVNSVTDLEELSQIFSHVPATMIAEARSFQLGEMLAAGPVAPTPIRLRTGERWSPEGGVDLPTDWASLR